MITAEQKKLIAEMAGAGSSWAVIAREADCAIATAKQAVRELGLWPKPDARSAPRPPRDEEPWFPPENAPDYGDSFQLKPEHRVRLEYVRWRRRSGRPVITVPRAKGGAS